MAKTIAFQLNGKPARVRVDDPEMPLLYALRDDLGLNNPHFGCGLAQCGAWAKEASFLSMAKNGRS